MNEHILNPGESARIGQAINIAFQICLANDTAPVHEAIDNLIWEGADSIMNILEAQRAKYAGVLADQDLQREEKLEADNKDKKEALKGLL